MGEVLANAPLQDNQEIEEEEEKRDTVKMNDDDSVMSKQDNNA